MQWVNLEALFLSYFFVPIWGTWSLRTAKRRGKWEPEQERELIMARQLMLQALGTQYWISERHKKQNILTLFLLTSRRISRKALCSLVISSSKICHNDNNWAPYFPFAVIYQKQRQKEKSRKKNYWIKPTSFWLTELNKSASLGQLFANVATSQLNSTLPNLPHIYVATDSLLF